MKKHFLFFLGIIVILAFFLRFYRVSNIPPALSWDEVSIGYNAYSILKTGYDEHQRFLPLDAFAAYGDYKPPLSVYITVPFVALFGLNELSVRLPSVIFGTLTVLLMYLLVKELFSKTKIYDLRSKTLPVIASLLLAFSPWHINLSRAGFEANIALFFVVLGIILLLKSLSDKKIWIICFLPFVASMYTFNSARYFVPLLGLGFIIINWKTVIQNFKYVLLGGLLAFIFLLPVLPHMVSKEAMLRFNEVNIFSDAEVVETSNKRMADDGNNLISKILDNRRVGYARLYMIHFLDHFQPAFLFIRGDGNPKFSIRDVGQFYIIEFPFLIYGFFMLVTQFPGIAWFLVYWMLMAIVPAATARETPHALRILNTLPVWHIFIAYGILSAGGWIHSRVKSMSRFTFYFLLFTFYLFNVGFYLHNYYAHYPKEYSGEWQYGYKQAIEYAQSHTAQYDHIYLTEKIGRAYMYTLFYTKYDPVSFWNTKDASFDASGFYHVYGFGTYRFIIDLPEIVPPKSLIITTGTLNGLTYVKTIPLLNGETALTIYETE